MSQFNIGTKAFTAGEAMEAYRRVKLSTGSGTQVEYADAGDAYIGFTAAAVNLGEMVSVILKTTGMTFKVTASGVIAVGGNFYGAIDGKVSATVNGSMQGRVLEAAASDGEIVEAILF